MKSLLSFFTIASCLSATSIAQIPAFPGAEGYGGRALGGRGGDVYIVTNLNTSGVGSFADAIGTVPTAGRTIVFGVSGHIHVNKTTLAKSKVTIAGQTAPGDGIGFKDGTFIISGDDIVIRHARFRYGKKTAGGDCINLSSGTLNAILDQVSIQFSTDENISSFNSPPENLTMQWALNGWGLESHSCGGLWDQNHASAHHSLWSHNHTRNPKARPNGLLEWVNNVTYDWDIGFIMGDSETPATWKSNVVGNYFLAPAGNIRTKALEKATVDRNGAPNFTVHLANNRHDSNGDGILNGTDKGYTIVGGSEFVAGDPVGANRYLKSLTPFASTGVPVTVDDPTVAFKKIVSKAGALRLDVSYSGAIRDEVDARMVSNLVTQTRNHISSETSLGLSNGGFGTLNSTAAPTDTDKDGMPDFYETALVWNVAVQDHNTALANSGGFLTGTTFMPTGTVAGYTRLEEYLHFKSIPHGSVPKNTSGAPTSIVINLAKFTSGFSASPVFTVSNAVGGTVSIAGTAATFTPTLNFTGRARFDFTVTDSAGHSWTQTCALVVTNNALPRDLKWAGDGTANVWDNGVLNWRHNGTPVATSGGDSVLFDDTGSNTPNVTLVNGFAGGNITVDATKNYTFAGGAAFILGPLTKRGTGTLSITATGTNSISPTTLDAGTLSVPGPGVGLGNPSLITLNGGTLASALNISATSIVMNNAATITPTAANLALGGALTGAGTANLNIGNNTFSLTGNTTAFAGTFALGSSTGFLRFNGSLGSPAATFDVGTSSADLINRNGNATFELGALVGGSSSFLGGASSVNAPSTYNIGANGNSTTFAGTIGNGGLGGVTNINKVGIGILTLTGNSTYTGTTTVSAGSLAVNGSIASATTVASGATLRGSGTYSGAVTAAAGAKISPGPASGAIGTLTAAGGLTATDTTFSMGLSSSPGGVNDKLSITGGTGQVNGTNTFDITPTDGTLGAGNYKLIECAPTIPLNTGAGMVMNLNIFAQASARQTYSLNRTASGTAGGYIQLTVTGTPATLTWTGATDGEWNTTATNWTGAAPATFVAGDTVVFNDTAATRSVTITGIVDPREMQVNTTLGYTFYNDTGSFDAGGKLVKSGTGTLTITTHNLPEVGQTDFLGGIILNAGTIALGNDYAHFSGGPITMNAGTFSMFDDLASYSSNYSDFIVPASANARINADSRVDMHGTLSGSGLLNFYVPWVRTTLFGDWSAFTGTIAVLTDASGGDFRIGSNYNPAGYPNATIHLAANTYLYYTGISNSGTGTTIEIGELRSDASAHLRGGVTGGRALTYRIGGKTPAGQEAVFRGDIIEQNTSTLTNYVKTGAGTWRLQNCTGTWSGSTTVEQGTLILESSVVVCNGATDVEAGATLHFSDTSGIETDALNIAVGATLSGAEDVDIIGDLNNDGTAIFYAGQINVKGDVVNNGTMRFHSGALLFPGTDFVNNGTLDLLASSSSLPTNFTNNGTVILNTERRILTAAKAAANFTVTAMGYVGHTYQLQRADTLTGAWTDIGAQQNGGGATLSFTDVGGATGAARFYRLVVGP